MSVCAVSSNSSPAQNESSSVMKQGEQDFKQLASALQSGNLAGAQKAFQALQQLQQSNPSAGQSSTGQAATTSGNAIQTDFAALGQALSSGNLSAAQSDFSQLKTDMQAAGASGASGAQSAHRGHHHRHASSASDSDSDSAASTASTTSASSQSGSTGSTISVYA